MIKNTDMSNQDNKHSASSDPAPPQSLTMQSLARFCVLGLAMGHTPPDGSLCRRRSAHTGCVDQPPKPGPDGYRRLGSDPRSTHRLPSQQRDGSFRHAQPSPRVHRSGATPNIATPTIASSDALLISNEAPHSRRSSEGPAGVASLPLVHRNDSGVDLRVDRCPVGFVERCC